MTTPDPAAVKTAMRVLGDYWAAKPSVREKAAREVITALDLDARDRAAEKRGAVTELRDAAHEIQAELVCCDAYDESGKYPQSHDLCYWAGAATALVIDRANRIEADGA